MILLKGLDIISEPDTINKLLIKLTKKEPDIKEIFVKKSNVQLFKHWLQMNGFIFKSVLV